MPKKIDERLPSRNAMRRATTRIVHGGGTGSDYHFGPGEFAPGYITQTNGWAARIACRTGEVIACVSPGTVHHFATWIAGQPDDVVTELRRAGRDELADTIEREAPGLEGTPIARLANFLGTTPEHIAAALRGVRVELREVRKGTAKKVKSPRKSGGGTGRSQKSMRPRRPYRTSIHQGL